MSTQAPATLVRPLQRRERPTQITRALLELGALSRRRLLLRLAEKDKDKRLDRETLVSVARTYWQCEDTEVAGAAITALTAHVSVALRAKMAYYCVPERDQEDGAREVLLGLYPQWLSAEPKDELWECNFTEPFKLRTLTQIKSFRLRIKPLEPLPTLNDTGEDAGGERDIPDPAAEAAFALLFQHPGLHAGLRALQAQHPQRADALHDKYVAEDTEAEIGKRYGVSSRTIRNWNTKACQFLQAFLEEPDTHTKDATHDAPP